MGLFDLFRRQPSEREVRLAEARARIMEAKSVTWNGSRGWTPGPSIWTAGDGAFSMRDEKALAEVYAKLDIVQACINAKAQAFINAPIMVSSGMGDEVQDYPEHPALDLFYKNPAYSYSEIWRLIIARLDLTGAAFNLLGLYKDIMGAGMFTPLPTHRVKRIMRGPVVLGYEFARDGQEPLPFKPEEVCGIVYPDPANFGGYVSPLQSAARAVNTDQQRQDTTFEVLKNKVIPGGFIEFEKDKVASKAQMEQLKGSIEAAAGQEVGNRGRLLALPAGTKFAPGVDVKDIDFTVLNALSETRICAALGVPPIIVGLKSGLDRSTFSNFAEAKTGFYTGGIQPLWVSVAEGLSRSAILGDPSLYFRFDFSQVKELQEDRTARVTRAVSLWNAGLATKDEARAEAGFQPVADGTGEEFKAPPPPPPGFGGEGGDEEDEDTEGKCSCGELHGKASAATAAVGYFKNSRPLAEALRRVFAAQEAEVSAAVLQGKLSGFNLHDWDKRVMDACRAPLRQLWEAEVRGKLYKVNARWLATPQGKSIRGKAVNVLGAFDIVRREALELLEKQLRDLAESVNGTTGERLDKAISEVVKAAEQENTVPALKKAVSGVFESATDSRARMIAVTESSRATHDGATLAAVKSGVVKSFQFLASGDACPDCLALDGSKVSLADAEAEIGSYERKLPPLHPNCLVGETPVFSPDKMAAFVTTYRGPVVEVTLADGRRLTVTPNHMLLTPGGFAAAASLRKGDYVVDCAAVKGVVPSNPNDNNSPLLVKNIVRAMAESPGVTSCRVPVAPEYLHGDARFGQGHIDIVGTDSLLADDTLPERRQELRQPEFCGADVDLLGLPRSRDLAAMLKTVALATDGLVSGPRKPRALLGREPLHAKLIGEAAVADWYARANETALECGAGYAQLVADTQKRLAGLVSPVQIVKVELRAFSGHVYDLQSHSSMYIANGILSSNCRCTYLEDLVSIEELESAYAS